MYYKNVFYLLLVSVNFTKVLSFSNFGLGRVRRELPASTTKTRWIDQPLDHFNTKEVITWKMKYLKNLEFWQPRGPIFLLIGGEYSIDTITDYDNPAEQSNYKTYRNNRRSRYHHDRNKKENHELFGLFKKLAYETHGAMFHSEHRFYGKHPDGDRNIKYLTSRQAIEDLATLLKKIKRAPKYKKSKVVLIGSSYAGNLAVWMRQLYPDLVDAAVAVSAPVLAIADFSEYLEAITDNYKRYGTRGCVDEIARIFERYESLFSDADGIKQLRREENICKSDDLHDPTFKHNFFMVKLDEFEENSQWGIPQDIYDHCRRIYSSRHRSNKHKRSNRHHNPCYSYKPINKYHKWLYQMCNEFGYFQSTSSIAHPFTDNIPVRFFYNLCKTGLTPDFNETTLEDNIKKTNQYYGGLKPNVTKVVFVTGGLDPWRKLAITDSLSASAPAIVIPGMSHAKFLMPLSYDDPSELWSALRRVRGLIKEWIGFEHE